MHTCNRLIKTGRDEWAQCREPASKSVIVHTPDGDTLFWLCDAHYADPAERELLEQAWAREGWAFSY